LLSGYPGDYRILNTVNLNSAMVLGASDIWGGDPGVVRRYAEFMTWTQGGHPDKATQYVNFTRLDPLYTMLRLRYAFWLDRNRVRIIEAAQPAMARVHLVSRYRVLAGRDTIFRAMRSESFDPRREVILEREPMPRPIEVEHSGVESPEVVSASTCRPAPSAIMTTAYPGLSGKIRAFRANLC
jgi:hypothetical protein